NPAKIMIAGSSKGRLYLPTASPPVDRATPTTPRAAARSKLQSAADSGSMLFLSAMKAAARARNRGPASGAVASHIHGDPDIMLLAEPLGSGITPYAVAS